MKIEGRRGEERRGEEGVREQRRWRRERERGSRRERWRERERKRGAIGYLHSATGHGTSRREAGWETVVEVYLSLYI